MDSFGGRVAGFNLRREFSRDVSEATPEKPMVRRVRKNIFKEIAKGGTMPVMKTQSVKEGFVDAPSLVRSEYYKTGGFADTDPGSAQLAWANLYGGGTYTITSNPPCNSCSGMSGNDVGKIRGLTPGKTYTFRITCTNSAGSSSLTTDPIFIPIPITAPQKPTGLTASPSAGKITLSWTAPTDWGGDTVKNYVIDYCKKDTPSICTTKSTTTTSMDITGLEVGKIYTIKLKAKNSNLSSQETTIEASLPITAPQKPTGLTATPSADKITLSWTAPTEWGGDNVKNYVIDYCKKDTSICTTKNSTTTSMDITGLEVGKIYTIKLKAKNSNLSSEETTIEASLPITAPQKPTGLTATPSADKITLSWTAPTEWGGDTVKNYVIGYCKKVTPAVACTSGIITTTNSKEITGLEVGVTYTFYVKSQNSSLASEELTVDSSLLTPVRVDPVRVDSVTSVNPTVTSVNPTVTSVTPTVTSVNPTVTSVNPTVTSVNPTVTSVNPTVTSVTPTDTTVTKPPETPIVVPDNLPAPTMIPLATSSAPTYVFYICVFIFAILMISLILPVMKYVKENRQTNIRTI